MPAEQIRNAAAVMLAAADGKPIEANPYVPDEPDGKWPFWNQGWRSA